jgi:hypothetical protein
MKSYPGANSTMTPILLGGLVLAGTVAGIALPRLLKSGRKAVGSFGGMTHRSHTPAPNVRPTADPARGKPA